MNAVALGDIRVFNPWSDAPLGAIIVMDVADRGSLFVMRSNHEAANGITQSVVVLSGELVGKMIMSADLSGPAIDASALVQLVAMNPAPAPYRSDSLQHGKLFLHPPTSTFYLWTIMLRASGSGWVVVKGPAQKLGAYAPTAPTGEMVVIADRIGIRERNPAA